MRATHVGTVVSGRGNTYEVWWDTDQRDIYLKFAGTPAFTADQFPRKIGKADTPEKAVEWAEESATRL